MPIVPTSLGHASGHARKSYVPPAAGTGTSDRRGGDTARRAYKSGPVKGQGAQASQTHQQPSASPASENAAPTHK
ncbi:hypothetical protein KIPB_003831, partial [Kipferlia bialata]|eukprot:g3831.t1